MKGDKKKIILISTLLVILILILLFFTFCSKKGENSDLVFSSDKGVNQPILAEEMKAIKWDGKDWVEVQDPKTDDSWYDYKKTSNDDTSQWANSKTEDGSMWVWIPRFAYKINNNKTEIIFLQKDTNKNTNMEEISKDYTVHPSFTGNVEAGGWEKEISGFWVSKFEAGKEDDKLVFKPNMFSYNNINIGEAYKLSKDLPYKDADPHMIKASEWGAVAYLAISPYGRNGIEVSSNNTKYIINENESTSVTAGGNGTDGLANTEFDALTKNANQSTTGNVYGVYDMAGGLWERSSAYINNGNANLMKNGKALLEDGSAGKSNKYKTVYMYDEKEDTNEANYNLNKKVIGDAIFETSNGLGEKAWFGDYSSFMFNEAPFLHRGGSTNNKSGVGIFAFSNTPGQAAYVLGFRCTLITE